MQDQTRPPQSDAPPSPGSRPLSLESRQQRLREIAHRIWEAEGRPDGRAEANWQAAEAELAAEEAARGSVASADDGCGPEEGGPAPGIRARRALAKAREGAGKTATPETTPAEKAVTEKTVARKKPARARPPAGAEAPDITGTPARTPRSRTRRPSEDA